MKVLKINGPIVDDSDAWFYDWFGDPHTSPKTVHDFLEEAGGEDIQISINSGGGSVFAGSEIYTALKAYSGKVTSVVTGLAASIASVIMLAGDTVKASPIAEIMIHNASMQARGDHRQLLHESIVIEGTSLSIAKLYAQKTDKTEDEMKQLMDGESWFTAEKALEIGLVDEVLFNDTQSIQLVASAGHIVSKEKIAEFKKMLASNMGDDGVFESRVKAIVEPMLDEIKNRPIAKAQVSIDAEQLAESLKKAKSDLTEEAKRVNSSPFSKFI